MQPGFYAPGMLDHTLVEVGTEVLIPPWNQSQRIADRKVKLGLGDLLVARFCRQCEFISLGNNCCVSFALQALDLKTSSYPLDWVRSPCEGVIQLLDTNFKDFFEYSFKKPQGEYPIDLYGGTSWGGSFWHHRIEDPQCREDFSRRIERFGGLRPEAPPTKPRVFVRLANSSSELRCSARLYQALRRYLPDTRIFLLVLVDLQESEGPLFVDEVSDTDVMFYRIHAINYADPTRDIFVQNEMNAEAYAAALATAIKIWCGRLDARRFHHMSSLADMEAMCQCFSGGDPKQDFYKPIMLPRSSTFQGARGFSLREAHRGGKGALATGIDRRSLSFASTADDYEFDSDEEESFSALKESAEFFSSLGGLTAHLGASFQNWYRK